MKTLIFAALVAFGLGSAAQAVQNTADEQARINALMRNGGFQRSLERQRMHDRIDNYNYRNGMSRQCASGRCW